MDLNHPNNLNRRGALRRSITAVVAALTLAGTLVFCDEERRLTPAVDKAQALAAHPLPQTWRHALAARAFARSG